MKLITGSAKKDFERWYKSFHRHMTHQDFEKNTYLVYNRILLAFGKFISEHEDVEIITDIKRDIILSFLEDLEFEYSKRSKGKRQKFAPKTKGLYIAILKAFTGYIDDHCDPDDNGVIHTFEPEFKRLAPKNINKKKKIKYLNDDEIMNTIDYLDRKIEERGSHYDFIHSLAIKIMIYAGTRITETLQLRLGDIIESDITNVHGVRDFYEIQLFDTKSGEEQFTLIKKSNIEKELEYFRSIIGEDDYIFKGIGAEERIDRSNFYKSVKKVFESAGVKRQGLHIFRHTAAISVYRKTKDILMAKELLRHSSLNTTMVYVTVVKRDLADGLR
ncbi:MAG: tyrosine-type recombinase/integrase [Campylobacterales bacterium]|nr:tyrosine-type recombinase/integrase [Campylobacterales bacterium]